MLRNKSANGRLATALLAHAESGACQVREGPAQASTARSDGAELPHAESTRPSSLIPFLRNAGDLAAHRSMRRGTADGVACCRVDDQIVV